MRARLCSLCFLLFKSFHPPQPARSLGPPCRWPYDNPRNARTMGQGAGDCPAHSSRYCLAVWKELILYMGRIRLLADNIRITIQRVEQVTAKQDWPGFTVPQ